MTRSWLLTWTTYGTWLPGDPRGFVTHVRTPDGEQTIHNEYGTPCDADMPGLQRYARSAMRQEPVWLTLDQARQVAEQLRETARFRGWNLRALAVMANHVHLVVEAPADTPGAKVLGDFKAYATRRLDREFAGAASGHGGRSKAPAARCGTSRRSRTRSPMFGISRTRWWCGWRTTPYRRADAAPLRA